MTLAGAVTDPNRNAFTQSVLDSLSAYFYAQDKADALQQAVMAGFKISDTSHRRPAGPCPPQRADCRGWQEPGRAALRRRLRGYAQHPARPARCEPGRLPVCIRCRAPAFGHAALADGLALKPEEIGWMLDHNADLGWMELDRLPYQTGITTVSFQPLGGAGRRPGLDQGLSAGGQPG